MIESSVNFEVNDAAFSQLIRRYAEVSRVSFKEATKIQGRLLCKELIERTPPFGGKLVVKMLEARGASLGFRDAEIESMSALKIGQRRVEKDIRKVIYGVRVTKHQTTRRAEVRPTTIVSQTAPAYQWSTPALEWGVFQRCEGKDAVRIYATESGQVYGVDWERFIAHATPEQLSDQHQAQRGKRGRTTEAGRADRVTGRWRWMDILVTSEAALKKYIRKVQQRVGQARGGWAKAYVELGGRISRSGWVGKHMDSGSYQDTSTNDEFRATITNNSRWASNGDPDRIIDKSLQGRAKALEKDIERRLEKEWKLRMGA